MAYKLPHLLCEGSLSQRLQDLAGLPPSSLYRLSRLDQRVLTRLIVEFSPEDFPADFLHARASTPGFTALLSSIDAIELG